MRTRFANQARGYARLWLVVFALAALLLLLLNGVSVNSARADDEKTCWRAKPAVIQTEYEKRYAGQTKDHNISYSEGHFTLQAGGKSNTISWVKPPDRICAGDPFSLSMQSSSGEGALVLGRFEVTGRCNTVSGDLFKGAASWGAPSNPALAPRQNTTVLTCTKLENIWVGAGSWGGTGNIPYADVRVTWEYEPEPEIAVPTATRQQAATPAAIPTQPADIDLSIDHIEVTQAIQNGDNSVPLVAGKSTVVRVFVRVTGNPRGPVSGVMLSACGMHTSFRGMTDTCVPGARMNTPFTAPLNPRRSVISDTINLYLPLEMTYASAVVNDNTTYPLELWINPLRTIPETNYNNNKFSQQLVFTKQNRLSVGYLRVGYQPPGQADPAFPSVAVSTYVSLTQKLYPIADNWIDYYEIPLRRPYTQPLFDPTNHPTRTFDLEDAFVVRLRKQYDLMSGYKPDQLIAWLPTIPDPVPANMAVCTGQSDPMWLTNAGRGAGRVAFVKDFTPRDVLYRQAVLAHEMAHNFGLRHTNRADACGAWDSDTQWPYATSEIQEFGFDVLERRVIPNTRFDMMSYCGNPGSNIWISPFTYTQLYDSALRPRDSPTPVPLRFAMLGRDGSPRLSNALTQPRLEQLIISGSIRRDGSAGRLDPAYHSADFDPGDPLPTSGNQCLSLSGASGTLATYCFTLPFRAHQSDAVLDEQGFTLKAHYPAGTTRVALVRDNRELAALTASPNAPALSITSPRAGETWTGAHTLAWNGADADGGKLTYTVLYTPNGGRSWYPLELDTSDSQLAIHTSEIASGDQVQFRVLASDGLNTTRADSPPIQVRNGIAVESTPQAPGSSATASADSGALLLIALGGTVVCGIFGALLIAGLVVITRPRARPSQRPRDLPERGGPRKPTNLPR
ncbi:MAG: hypothetical protein HY782_06915 [Chloroflexi bacterium]|nr:hypothetical protein [Chloroflexota bacterium]